MDKGDKGDKGDKSERREIGLRAVDEARRGRNQKADRKITGPVALVAGGSVLTMTFIAWMVSGRTLDNAKTDLLSKQRAAVQTVGKEWSPLRDKIEKTTIEAAGPFKGDFVDPEAEKWDFRSIPGIYLRLRVEDAKDVTAMRTHARDSGRDAFTGCLLRENNPSMAAVARGEEDAGTGWQDQPWNLRLAYRATRMLQDDWVAEVNAAEDELHVRVFAQQYEKAQKEEIPLTIDIVKRAQFFLLVLDEDVPEAKELTVDGGKVTPEIVQQVPHPARIHVVNLKTDKEIVRLRREASAEFRFAGERSVRDPAVLAAMKRQVQNCSLAQNVWASIRPGAADDTKVDADGGTSGDGGASKAGGTSKDAAP